ncbi:MAG: histidinol-phosphate transaminase [Spirochaetales bacterium]|nr:histidinol-phosphate transaminase [Spirochaetales bacterium]MCF7937895.1 histidinol-phosphate transaminase [Spirochaetales bacterium]
MKTRKALDRMVPYSAGVKQPGAIKLSSNENVLGPSPAAVKAVQAQIDQLHFYPDGGAADFRAALARHLSLEPDRLIFGNGSDELMVMAAGAFLNPGETSIIGEHSFSEYRFATRLFDGELSSVPMNEGAFDLEGMVNAVNGRTRMIFLTNPNNPTGRYIGEAELRSFLDRIAEWPEILCVLDEAYYDFADSEDFPDSRRLIDDYPNLLVLRTFSKLYGLAGLRIGYGMAGTPIIAAMEKTRQPFNLNSLAQAAGAAALDDRDFVERSRTLVGAGRRQLTEGLRGLGLTVYPSQANFLCFDTERDARRIFEELAKEGVTIRPLASFGMDSWIRVTVGTREQNEFFLEALGRVLCSF